jgi:penicillin-binding protein 1A
MSHDDQTITHEPLAPPPIPFERPRRRRVRGQRLPKPQRPKLRKLRLLAVLSGFGMLALISTLFGMMMAIASDLPQLENRYQYKHDFQNSFMYDSQNRPIGILATTKDKVLDTFQEISPYMRKAIVSVEDRRFWTEPGVDIRGLLRAFVSDVAGGPTQGASTIAEQFVKNALGAANNRTIMEKLREAVLAYHLTRAWVKGKIMREYLNTIYFGHGAYGIESAARIYFGKALGYNGSGSATTCGDANAQAPKLPKCASLLKPWQAAMLAGMVANPSEFDPVTFPVQSLGRRNLVLADMEQQGYITHSEYQSYAAQPLGVTIQPPQQPPAAPYFTSWVEPQVVAALRHAGMSRNLAGFRAYYGGLKIHTTIDLAMQNAAQQAVLAQFPASSNGPTASLVAIDNHTGQVRAMVSGDGNYSQMPFNIATQAQRQPGSSFKPFTLAEALMHGYGPSSVITSAPQDFIVPNSGGKEHFIVHNFGNTYSGPISLQAATAISDNTVFSQVGIHVGTTLIAHLAKKMGIRTPVSNNYAMILGGLRTGVSALDMAHAYETLATGGLKVYDPKLGDFHGGPIGIDSITCATGCPFHTLTSHPVYQRILPAPIAQTVHDMLLGVVSSGGTAPMAAIPGVDVVGKTGTTTNYADAWFVGWTPQITTAVWVGYPNGTVPMATNYNGQPVEGGTFPAIIWHDFMVQALAIVQQEAALKAAHGKVGALTTTNAVSTGVGTGTGATPTSAHTATGPANTTTNANAKQTATTGGAAGNGGTPTTGAATNPANTPTTGGGGGGGTPTTGAGGGTPTTGGGGGTPTTGGGGGTATGSGGAGLGAGG